ncbi:hypothetical protein Bca52824_022752 [Brassica carinata]|uniref:Uncharacterized protein n=1 Tax=Brassica carinata TaxID=52824 RepID=A0A8X7VGZ4_BRACI|nr:hypothetical protein Bca52824_022752 [Brassica carinata]
MQVKALIHRGRITTVAKWIQNQEVRSKAAIQELNHNTKRTRSLTYEGFEQKFMDDITRLAKDQIAAEDAEIARYREKINTISTRYEERLAALRARHTVTVLCDHGFDSRGQYPGGTVSRFY